jgi:hypothetical protein
MRPRSSRVLFLAAVLSVLARSAATAQPAPLGAGLNVTVTSGGQPASGATVCVGTSGDPNAFFQGVTNSQGRVSFASVPAEGFVLTARLGIRGAAETFSIARPGGVPFFSAAISLPQASGGPSCPTTPAGPDRRIGSGIAAAVARLTPIPFPTSIVLNLGLRCFGALGADCGQPQGLIPPTALCSGGTCFVNGGSWDHDECCFRNKGGVACNLPHPDDGSGTCGPQFAKAILLAGKGLMWSRRVDFNERNPTGVVNHAEYCAPANTLLPPEDGAKCCSRATRPVDAGAEAAAELVTGLTLRVCR